MPSYAKYAMLVALCVTPSIVYAQDTMTCGGQLYSTEYTCHGNVACPSGQPEICGTVACYNSNEHACVDSVLVPLSGTVDMEGNHTDGTLSTVAADPRTQTSAGNANLSQTEDLSTVVDSEDGEEVSNLSSPYSAAINSSDTDALSNLSGSGLSALDDNDNVSGKGHATDNENDDDVLSGAGLSDSSLSQGSPSKSGATLNSQGAASPVIVSLVTLVATAALCAVF